MDATPTEYQVLCKHLPARTVRREFYFESVARDYARALELQGRHADYAANPVGGFTVFVC